MILLRPLPTVCDRDQTHLHRASCRLGAHQQGGTLDSKLAQGGDQSLGLVGVHSPVLDHQELAGGQFHRQRVAQGGTAGPLGERVVVAAGLGAVDRAAALPERGPDGADAGAAGALLLPELAAGAGDFPAGLGGSGAGAALGQVVADRLPDQVLVDVFELEDFRQQVDGAGRGVVQTQVTGC